MTYNLRFGRVVLEERVSQKEQHKVYGFWRNDKLVTTLDSNTKTLWVDESWLAAYPDIKTTIVEEILNDECFLLQDKCK